MINLKGFFQTETFLDRKWREKVENEHNRGTVQARKNLEQARMKYGEKHPLGIYSDKLKLRMKESGEQLLLAESIKRKSRRNKRMGRCSFPLDGHINDCAIFMV